jgi:hypothetical protein
MNAEPWLYLTLIAATVYAAGLLINASWRWLTRPRRIVTQARLYRWPDAKRRER